MWKEIDNICARTRKKEEIKVWGGSQSHLAPQAVLSAPLLHGLCSQVLLIPASRPALQITAHRRTFAKKTGLIPLGLLFLPVSGGSLGEQSQVHVACKPPVMRDIVCCSPLLGLASPFCLLTKSCPGPSPLEEGRGIWEAGFAAYPQCWNKNAPWVNSRNPV